MLAIIENNKLKLYSNSRETYKGYTLVISSDGSVEVLDGSRHLALMDNKREAKDYIDNLKSRDKDG